MSKIKKRVLSGIQPSGKLHLGNYFGMMSRMIEYQNNSDLFCCIVNYHALTTIQDKNILKNNTINAAIDFLALGMDPQKSTFWIHTFNIWAMYFLMTYVCFFSLEETAHLTATDGLFLLVLGGIGMVIPTPGGIGSYHAIVMIGLSVLGVGSVIFGGTGSESNPALLFPTIIHAGQTLMGIMMGLIGLLILFLSKKKNNVAS